MVYDVKANVTNLRTSKTPFATGYRPSFQILPNYLTTGEITLIENKILSCGTTSQAYIRFLTPDNYPHSLWVGKIIYFYEGEAVTGSAEIIDIYNNILLSKNHKVDKEN